MKSRFMQNDILTLYLGDADFLTEKLTNYTSRAVNV